MQNVPLLSAIKHLSMLIERLESKVSELQKQIDAMQEEWRHEFELESDAWETASESGDTEESGDEESENESVCSAPATFSYKVQRIT